MHGARFTPAGTTPWSAGRCHRAPPWCTACEAALPQHGNDGAAPVLRQVCCSRASTLAATAGAVSVVHELLASGQPAAVAQFAGGAPKDFCAEFARALLCQRCNAVEKLPSGEQVLVSSITCRVPAVVDRQWAAAAAQNS